MRVIPFAPPVSAPPVTVTSLVALKPVTSSENLTVTSNAVLPSWLPGGVRVAVGAVLSRA